jgi:hypothetical protein
MARRGPRFGEFAIIGIVCVLGSVTVALAISQQAPLHLISAAMVVLAFLIVASISPRRLLLLIVVWLLALGAVRRLLFVVEPQSQYDPLLLVAPAGVAMLALFGIRQGAFRQRTPLANAALVLGVLTLLGAANPLQGSLLTGVAGLLFFLVPQLGFWVGRSIVDDRLFLSLAKIIGVAVPLAAVYGLVQTFVGFPPWDQAWLDSVNSYIALSVGGTTRAFASFSSASEYASILAVGIIFWLAFGIRRLRPLIALPLIGLLAIALVLESSRGIIVMVLVTVVLMAACRLRWRIWAAGLGATLVVLLIPTVISAVPVTSAVQGPTAGLVQHVTDGLSDPFGQTSTLPVHIAVVVQGLQATVSHPLGTGIGTVSLAAQKFGGVVGGTELDLSDVGQALGLPGILAYAALVVLGLRTLYRVASVRGDALALMALGIASVLFMHWLNGGQYAAAILPWLALGWADRQGQREALAAPSEVEPRVMAVPSAADRFRGQR